VGWIITYIIIFLLCCVLCCAFCGTVGAFESSGSGKKGKHSDVLFPNRTKEMPVTPVIKGYDFKDGINYN